MINNFKVTLLDQFEDFLAFLNIDTFLVTFNLLIFIYQPFTFGSFRFCSFIGNNFVTTGTIVTIRVAGIYAHACGGGVGRTFSLGGTTMGD